MFNFMKKIQFLTCTLLLVSIFFLPTKIATAELKATLEGHTNLVWSVAFSPNGKMLASASLDATVRLWNVNTERLLHTLTEHTDEVSSVAFSPDGKTLVSASWDATIRLWNPHNGKLKRTLTEHTAGVASVAFSPDGKTLASAGEDQTIRLWNTTTWKLERILRGHTHIVDIVAFSPDSRMLASGSRDTTIRFWNLNNGKHIKTLTGHTGDILRMAFSPDGAVLASGSLDQTVRLWNPKDGKLRKTLAVQRGWINPVAFSPDGATLVIGDSGILAWDTRTGQYNIPLAKNLGQVLSVVFSPDGQMVASGSTDNKVQLWEFVLLEVPYVDDAFDTTNIPGPVPPPAAVRNFFELDPFYQQWINVGGLPVLASSQVSLYAVKEAAWTIWQMIGHRRDILQTMAQNRVRFSVIAHNELMTQIPEFRDLRPGFYWDIRSRGSGGQTTTGSEENLLRYSNDPYSTENVLIHEFAHTSHDIGLNSVDPGFDNRLRITYEMAIEDGLWQGTYASTDRAEYWAEGVQSWFNANAENTPLHNHVNTRAELKDYDPPLAALLTEVFGDKSWRYTLPATRTHLPHLRGFNPQNSPTFQWPPEAVELYDQLNNPNSDGGGEWVSLQPHDPSELVSLNASRTTGSITEILFVNLTGDDVLVYWVDSDGTEVFRTRQSLDIRNFETNVGDIWLLKDAAGNNLSVYRAEAKTGRVLVGGVVPSVPGEKIAGSWLWIVLPTGEIGGAEAADSEIDWLAQASSGAVTEQEVAINGATAGDKVGDQAWTLGELSTTGDDNINELVNTIGLATGDIDYHVAYGYIALNSPNEQNTRMYVGSDDAVQVWLNGDLVHNNPVNRGAADYQDEFPVTLKAGNNILLVAVYDLWGGWSGFFGFENNAVYTIRTIVADAPKVPAWDVNRDGRTNVLDLVLVAQHLGSAASVKIPVDVNDDGVVNVLDLVIVAQHLGESTGAAAPFFLVRDSKLNPTIIQAWIEQAHAENDGSLTFQQGITNLQRLLASMIPTETSLLLNYPNPFNPETWIPYQLSEPAEVTLHIYAVDGQVIRQLALGHQSAGMYRSRSRAAYWDGNNEVGESVASGVYFYTLTAGEFTATRKMLILK